MRYRKKLDIWAFRICKPQLVLFSLRMFEQYPVLRHLITAVMIINYVTTELHLHKRKIHLIEAHSECFFNKQPANIR